MAHPCPCCGHLTFNQPHGSYDLCPVCFWEDDAYQLRYPELLGRANGITLVEAQQYYRELGACAPDFVNKVRPATDAEPLDPKWRMLDPVRDNYERADDPRPSTWPDWPALYWWRDSYQRR